MASSQTVVNDKSLLSVQELAKEPMFAIPQRYVQVHQEPTVHSDAFSLPIVDMKNLSIGGAKDLELENLHSICKTLGIFQYFDFMAEQGLRHKLASFELESFLFLDTTAIRGRGVRTEDLHVTSEATHQLVVNHGVSSLRVEKLKHEIEEFYKLPVKEKYKVKPGDVEGYGHTMIRSEDEKAHWGVRLYMITNPIHRRKPHLLPELPVSLRDTLEFYFSELQKNAMTLLGLMVDALKIDNGEIKEMFMDGMQSVRMNYYPPCPQPEQVMGFTPHSDVTGITILLEINGVAGFQVKKDGKKISSRNTFF
ncbi:unnamed protein product [Ilex paraguariensis]|uniref:Uncharacterized protein n=1 Tax=Ilex paraguariensis TaxID=185542 RepID=A0ABC8QV58_9AQUA